MHVRLADAFTPDEIPTRPDTPNACASRCRHCGAVYGDHVITVPPAPPRHMWNAECHGMRSNFRDEDRRPADVER